jgi:hypothetical protein
MTPSAIVTALQAQLRASSAISYIDDTNIFLGRRTNIANYPVIVIEPSGSRVLSQAYPFENIAMRIVVAGGVRVFDEDKQLVGSGDDKGLLDLKNDIKKALCSDPTLGGACIDLNIIDDEDDSAEDYPVRGFAINIEVTFRQNAATRE